MKKTLLYSFVAVITFVEIAFAYSVTTNRPRIWLTPSEVPKLQSRCETLGQSKTEYDRIKSWVDSHINDSISSISQNSNYRDSNRDANNMSLHLMRTSLVYVVSGSTTYARRVADLLYWLSQNGSGYYSHSARSGDPGGMVYPALSIAYDWCYEQLNYGGNRSAITNYLNDIVSSAVTNNVVKSHDNNMYVYYKTEEPYYLAFPAFAIYGSSGVNTTNVNECIARFEYYIRDYGGTWDESGFKGGVPFNGTYIFEQLQYHRASFFELWRNATDENLWQNTDTFYEGPLIGSDNARYYYRWKLMTTKPNGNLPRHGDSGVSGIASDGFYGPEMAYIAAKVYQDRISQYIHNIAVGLNDNYNNNSYYRDRMEHDFFYCLWYDPSLEGSIAELEESKLFNGVDQVVMRSGYNISSSSTDLYLLTAAHKKHDYGHWSGDFGHITMMRGGDVLLNDSGYYRWSHQDHYDNYHSKPWAHNVIVVNNRDFVAGVNQGDGFYGYSRSSTPQSSQNDFGSIDRFRSLNDNYAYTQIDLTKAYNSAEASNVKRNIAFLDDQWFVICDVVQKTDSTHSTKVLWHTNDGMPVRATDNWGSVGGDCYDDRSNGVPVVSWNSGNSKVYYSLLYPVSDVTMRLVGGSGCEYTDMSYNNHGTGDSTDAGSWRFEVFSNQNNLTDTYLSVFQAVNSSANQQSNNALSDIDPNFVGCEIRSSTRSVALFSKSGSDMNETHFVVSDDYGPAKILVTGLVNGSYEVSQNGVTSINSASVYDDGVLFFETDLNNGNSFLIWRVGEEAPEPLYDPKNLRTLPPQ